MAHPQIWPKDLDCTDKKVVCIGSGATAITLVPVPASNAATQSVIYYVIAQLYLKHLSLQKYLTDTLAFTHNRLRLMIFPMVFYCFCCLFPTVSSNVIRKDAAKQLPEGQSVDLNLKPRYSPFDQRVYFAPDGDFYATIRSDRAKFVTDTVQQVVDDGIMLKSGAKIDADIIVTAS